ncbi:MAG: hypothetical protein L0215_12555, partial [Gemmataceae bacterium]|nr:hypothetical protein [Gemmataceae bacterium]
IITTRMEWIGGTMTGNGITRINAGANMLVDVEATPTGTSVTQTGRILENQGIVNFGSSDELTTRWVLDGGATIDNRAQFNINSPAGRSTDIVTGPDLGSAGSFLNSGDLVVNAPTAAASIFLTFVRNSGAIRTNSGTLGLSVNDFRNYGFFETQAAAVVSFGGGEYTFDPEAEDTSSDMMRGPGWYRANSANLENLARIIVPQIAFVQANNFELTDGGVVQGLGTFSANYFLWTGGSMERGNEQPGGGIGVTRIDAGKRMVINGNVSLSGREVRNHGTIEWQTYAMNIDVGSLGTFINDGGTFDLFNQFGEMRSVAPDAGKLINRNGGLFRVNQFLSPAAPVILVAFENQNALVLAKGDIQFLGGFLQSGQNADSIFEAGIYRFNSFSRSIGGTIRLLGGTLDQFSVPGGQPVSENTTFLLSGSLTRSIGFRDSRLELTGNLNCGITTQRVEALGSETHLHGHTLTTGVFFNGNSETQRGVLYRENGTIRAELRSEGDVRNPGTIDGDYEMLSSATDQIGDGASFGTLILTGDFTQQAGVTFTFGIGVADHDRLTVLGQASVNGTLAVALESGFLPDAELPDVFDIITAPVIDGAFENTTIDLPGDLYFDIVIDGDSVALVTRTT